MLLTIFIIFLISNLIIGLKYSKGVTNITDYALGGRNFSTATIAATLISTWMAGSNLSITAYETYNQGLYYVIPGIADGISFFIVAYLYAPRMVEFLGKVSVAQAMGDLYGNHVRLITAISSAIIGIGNIAIQFTVLTAILNYCLGFSGIYSSIISATIVITYSTFGGIKAVTFTDVIQFFTFGIILPMSVYIIWKSTSNNNISTVLTENSNFEYKNILSFKNPNLLETIFLFLFFLIPGLDPVIFQRISMARDTSQVSKSFTIAGITMIFLEYGVIAAIGVLLLANNATNLDSDNIVNYLLDNYFNSTFKGFFVIGVMAMLMSTADSYINSTSVLISHDIFRALGITLSNKLELIAVRISALCIGILALILSIFSQDLLTLILSTYSFYMPIVSVPLILAIFGFRSTSKSVLLGMLFGFLTVVIIKLYYDISSLIPGMIANALTFIGSHYVLRQQGGLIGTQDNSILQKIRRERKKRITKLFNLITQFNFVNFCKSNLPKEERILVYFGLFNIISLFSNAYSLPNSLDSELNILEYMYYLVLFLAMIFVTYPFWIDKLKSAKNISIIWFVGIFFNSVFIHTLFIILSKFSSIQTVILMGNLTTVAILLRWEVAIIMILGGVTTGFGFYKIFLGTHFIPENIDDFRFKIVYSLLLISTILIAFLKPKQEYQELTEEQNEHLSGRIEIQEEQVHKALGIKEEFLRNIQHEYHTPMTGVISLSQALLASHKKMSPEKLEGYLESIYKSALRIDSYDNNINMLSKLSKADYKLNLEQIDLSNLLYERIETCRRLYEQNKDDREFVFDIKDNIIATIDKEYFTRLLDNLIINAISYCKQGRIITVLKYSDNNRNINLTVADEGIGIPANDIDHIFGKFTVSSKTWTPAGGRGVGLALCKRIIEVHNGNIEAESNGIKGAIFKINFPIS